MKKILLIEDNDDIRNNTAEILELSNYQVITADDGKSGVELAIAQTPDLIICDIMMPVLDGYGVLHALHKNNGTRNIPFIFLTAKTERGDLRRGMELGADDYITKPFSGTELLNAVDGRLKKMEGLKQDFAGGLEGMQQLLKISSTKKTLHSLAEDRSSNLYKKKQVIYSEGSHPARLFYVLRGKVKTYRSNEDGKELVTELYNAGDFLGYVPLLENSVYKDTAEAMEETELALIPKEEFTELISQNPAVSQQFIRLLARNVSSKEDQLLRLAYNSLRRKVADALLLLDKKYGQNQDEKFVIAINRESLASIAGTATESLIRTLSDFRNEKLIDIKVGGICILNRKKLEQMRN